MSYLGRKGIQRLYDGEAEGEAPLERRGIGSKTQKRREATLGNGRNMGERDGQVRITHCLEDWPRQYRAEPRLRRKIIYILKDPPQLVRIENRGQETQEAPNLIRGSWPTSTSQQ